MRWGPKEVIRRVAQSTGYDIARRSSKPGDPLFDSERSIVCEFMHKANRYVFFVENPNDLIQKCHVAGTLYELEELAIIEDAYDSIGAFIDIGANVGNHTLFALVELGAPRVIAFEPGLKQHSMMTVNLALNGTTERVSLHKVGLSDIETEMYVEARGMNNLGGMRLSQRRLGERIQVKTGDSMLSTEDVSFIKIDVEGHELEVLRGLEQTIDRCRPTLFIEVEDGNVDGFLNWVRAHRYEVSARFSRYGGIENYLVVSCMPTKT